MWQLGFIDERAVRGLATELFLDERRQAWWERFGSAWNGGTRFMRRNDDFVAAVSLGYEDARRAIASAAEGAAASAAVSDAAAAPVAVSDAAAATAAVSDAAAVPAAVSDAAAAPAAGSGSAVVSGVVDGGPEASGPHPA